MTNRTDKIKGGFPSWETHRTAVSPCPWCGAPLDGATGQNRGPRPGDFSLCLKCASLLRFDNQMRLVAVPEVVAQMELDAEEYARLELGRRVILAMDRRGMK